MATPDRTDFVPSDQGQNVLPNNPLFNKLLRLAYDEPEKIIIRDDNLRIEKSRAQLLTDILTLQRLIRDTLDFRARERLEKGQPVFVAILAPGGYEYTVGILAALAIGAAVVPMTTLVPVKEAMHFIRQTGAMIVLTSNGVEKLAVALYERAKLSVNPAFKKIPISLSFQSSSLSPHDIKTSSDRFMDDNAPGLVIFTSGTTGRPKGAVHRRAAIHEAARSVADHYKLTDTDVLLHLLPVHHATGTCISFFPFLISGACIEFRSGSFDPAWTWERWRQGGLTFFTGVPTIYTRMMRFYDQHLSKLPLARRNEYIFSANQFRGMLCGTMALPKPVQQFWTSLRDGKAILIRYGGTETGAICKVTLDPRDTSDGSVGEAVPGSSIKLSDGDQGELLFKSSTMFSGYLYDEKATAEAHDKDGYFKTGDIARREGHYYFILGRASIDILKSGGYKISALEIERECLGLPYIHEVIVVGVTDEEWGQRVAAVVNLRIDQSIYTYKGQSGGKELTLNQLRDDLSQTLARYKLPTLLRVIQGEIPKTATGKVQKKVLRPRYFPLDYIRDPEVQRWNSSDKQVMSRL